MPETKPTEKRWPEQKFYRRTRDGNGACSSWKLSLDDKNRWCVFLQLSRQKNADVFDHDNAIYAKLNANDVAQILLVLEGDVKSMGVDGNGLFHENKRNGTYTTIVLENKAGKDELPRFYLGVFRKKGDNKANIGHSLTMYEGRILRELLSYSILMMANWIQSEAKDERR